MPGALQGHSASWQYSRVITSSSAHNTCHIVLWKIWRPCHSGLWNTLGISGLDRCVTILQLFGCSGHLVEALMSKVGAVMGREGDATPFTEVTVDNISTTLHRCVSSSLPVITWLRLICCINIGRSSNRHDLGLHHYHAIPNRLYGNCYGHPFFSVWCMNRLL